MADADSTVTYKDIFGFPGYRVGDDGSVWSRRRKRWPGLLDSWRQLKPARLQQKGYLVVDLFPGSHKRLVHRIVLEAFVGPCPPGMECCHGNGVRTDNRLGNLRWDTRKANHADSIRDGTDCRGERHGRSKITSETVRGIRTDAASGQSQRKLATKYGLSKSQIARIVHRKSWTDVT